MISLDQISTRQEPTKVLLVEPSYYQIIDTKNPYMDANTEISTENAHKQWGEMKLAFEAAKQASILENVESFNGVRDLEDMVYCANQSFPWVKSNSQKHVIISNMKFPSRQKEVPYFEEFYKKLGYEVHHLPKNLLLEGMGDCISHPFKNLVWMGYGWRTSKGSSREIEQIFDVEVIPLKLMNEYFYHLDTCFLPINENKVALCTSAFDDQSLNKIRSVFREVIEIDEKEAIETFCLNTTCLYHKENPIAITQKGDHSINRLLKENGYQVIEVETGEFIKGGGSVFCMKMMYY